MRDIESLLQQEDQKPDKALTTEQLLRYADDLAEVFQSERDKREALEAANVKLEAEIFERKKAQKRLEQSEKKYRTLFEESRDAICIADERGRFVDVNWSFLELFSCTKAEALGSTGKMFVPREAWRKFHRELHERGFVKDHEMQLRKKGGAVMECLVSGALTRASDGSILRYQGIVRDVTEYKLSLLQLQNAKKMDALGSLAGGVAHEIRNPLAISSSAAQILMDDDVSESLRKDCATKIVSGIERASIVIENLLTFARPESEFGMTSLDLVSLVRESEKSVSHRAKDQEIQLNFAFHPQPLFVNGNPSLLLLAFMNLFMNALAAMRESGGTLSVTVERNASDALIKVSDTGHGILNEHLGKIFDPFFSLWDKGTGLGLSIAYSIFKLHSGTVRAASIAGSATTFTVSIPLA